MVPASFQAEDLANLVTRVLYRLRFQGEQESFDPSTYAMASPVIMKCIEKGGVGIGTGEHDAATEQLALAVDIIAFHVKCCKLIHRRWRHDPKEMTRYFCSQ